MVVELARLVVADQSLRPMLAGSHLAVAFATLRAHESGCGSAVVAGQDCEPIQLEANWRYLPT